VTTIKKYSNRRLYDTELSRYITLDELAEKIRSGTDVEVVDAKSGDDLTQTTLTQLILEGSASSLLPVPLLHRLIRMQDDAFAEFFSKYVSSALDIYLAARDGAQNIAPFFPFAGMPMQATSALLRMFGGAGGEAPATSRKAEAPPRDEAESTDEMAQLRRELAELRDEIRRGR
jgi:polyhydroxyalkanoate synthesis repressor PhaR